MAINFVAKDFLAESENILTECAQAFSQDTISLILQEKILDVKLQLNTLKNALVLAKSNIDRKNLTENMKAAYITIMNVRKLLLGNNANIQYRLYVRGNNIDNVKIVDMNENQLMQLIQRSGNDLRLRRTFANIDALQENTEIQQLFDQHFTNISRSLKHVDGNNYVVPFDRVKDVIRSRVDQSNLYWQNKNGPRGKSAYSPKLFNRGWIYQAFDATVAELYANDNTSVSEEQFRFAYFNRHLRYDQTVGFKGGDVGLNQIKSNMANLINITTLINYLDVINDILTPSNFQNSTALAQHIKNEFTTQENLSEDIAQFVNQTAEKLYSLLTL